MTTYRVREEKICSSAYFRREGCFKILVISKQPLQIDVWQIGSKTHSWLWFYKGIQNYWIDLRQGDHHNAGNWAYGACLWAKHLWGHSSSLENKRIRHKTALGIKSTVPKIALFLSNPHTTWITLKRITAIDSVLCSASPGKKCGRFSVHPTSFSPDYCKTSSSDTLLVFLNVNRFIKRSIWIKQSRWTRNHLLKRG